MKYLLQMIFGIALTWAITGCAAAGLGELLAVEEGIALAVEATVLRGGGVAIAGTSATIASESQLVSALSMTRVVAGTEMITYEGASVARVVGPNSIRWVKNGQIASFAEYGGQFARVASPEVNYLNFRTGPGTNYTVINQIQHNQFIWVEGRTAENWYKIRYGRDNRIGYVSGKYVDLLGGAAAGAAVAHAVMPQNTPTPITFSSCYSCSGDGQINCGSCSATGYNNCGQCAGSGHAACHQCHGNVRYPCTTCDQKGQIAHTCGRCDGDGKLFCGKCGGSGIYGKGIFSQKCYSCNATGLHKCPDCKGVGKHYKQCEQCAGGGYRICGVCMGKATEPCTACHQTGKVICGKCSGKAQLSCGQCHGAGKIRNN